MKIFKYISEIFFRKSPNKFRKYISEIYLKIFKKSRIFFFDKIRIFQADLRSEHDMYNHVLSASIMTISKQVDIDSERSECLLFPDLGFSLSVDDQPCSGEDLGGRINRELWSFRQDKSRFMVIRFWERLEEENYSQTFRFMDSAGRINEDLWSFSKSVRFMVNWCHYPVPQVPAWAWLVFMFLHHPNHQCCEVYDPEKLSYCSCQ